MAEYCLDCWKEINGGACKSDFILSKELDLCECCGEWKHVIVAYHQSQQYNIFGCVAVILKYIGMAFRYLWKILKNLYYNLKRRK